jgi:succinate dehydrogenase / fumarate reductase cytochrome b subunit
MTSLPSTLRASLGSKYLMALTGAVLLLWVVAHLVGNLQAWPLLGGRAAFNEYAHFLKSHPGLLWTSRGVMTVVLVVHVAVGLNLARKNRDARPVRYEAQRFERASFASRSMVLTGLCILAYLVYHLLHFTIGVTNPEHFASREVLPGGAERQDVFRMLVLGFRRPEISLAYVVAMVFLALHLSHGASSIFQSLGINHPRYQRLIERLGPVLGVAISAGFLSIPAAVWAGIITL